VTEKLTTDSWGNPLMPLSIKAVVIEDNKIWLRKNEYDRWELPGGRPEKGEQPERAIVREIAEELGLEILADKIIDVYIWEKDFGSNPIICIVTFACSVVGRVADVEHMGEAGEAKFEQFSAVEALSLATLPDVYKRAIKRLG